MEDMSSRRQFDGNPDFAAETAQTACGREVPTTPHSGATDAPKRPMEVEGPFGDQLTLASLPPPDTRRWVVRRKAEVLSAINGGLLTAAEACARYRLSPEELELWQASIDRAGVPGLRVTRIQLYRDYPVAKAPARSSASSAFVPSLAWQA